MSIYKSGVDAYRDTTKWLVAFIPVTAITTTAVLLAAPLRAGALAASDPSTWMARHGSIVWCAIVVIAAIGAIPVVRRQGAECRADRGCFDP